MKRKQAKTFVRSAINVMAPYNVDAAIGKRHVLAMQGVMLEYHATVSDMMTPAVAMRLARLTQDDELVALFQEARSVKSDADILNQKVKIKGLGKAKKSIDPIAKKVDAKTQLWRKAGALHRPKAEGILRESVIHSSNTIRRIATDKAIAYARDNAARLVTDITTTDMNRIARIVEKGIREKTTINNVAKDILDAVNDDQMTQARSEMIAVTEVNNAMAYGANEAYREAGAETKSWFSVEGACEMCDENAAAGVIPMHAEFPSGHDYPTAHPWCRCFCVYYGAEGKETEE